MQLQSHGFDEIDTLVFYQVDHLPGFVFLIFGTSESKFGIIKSSFYIDAEFKRDRGFEHRQVVIHVLCQVILSKQCKPVFLHAE